MLLNNTDMKAQMDSILTIVPHQGGWYIFTNHEEVVDEEGRVSYVADAEWTQDKPEEI